MFTSNDHQFVQTVANRINAIDGTVTDDKVTTYDEYLESKGLI
ncbi:MAG: hypothetical protein R2827_12775 [Bdellovibrionales bacterium]